MQVLRGQAPATRLASSLPSDEFMSVQVGWWGVGIAAAIGGGAAWFLEWPPAASAAFGALLVPLVAVVAGAALAQRQASPAMQPPPRGVCECGHVMSMHCASDGSGPCAAADCHCAGRDHVAFTQ
jgi:hypothetical protein